MSIVNDTTSSALSNLGLSNTQPATANKTKLGQAEFLELMIAQLENQDPFKPMENGDFIAQMAQFSTVTGLDDLNTSFGGLASSLQSNQVLQASTLVGRSVVIPSSTAYLDETSRLNGYVDLTASTGNLTVTIEDPITGEAYRKIELGQQSAGQVAFNWDGLDDKGNALPAGRYAIQASTVQDGKTYSLDTLTTAQVDSVTMGANGQGISLNLAQLGAFDLANVREIK